MKKLLFAVMAATPLLMGCPDKRGKTDPPPPTPVDRQEAAITKYQVAQLPAASGEIDLTADSAFLYAKEMYLWNTNIKTQWDSSLLEIGYSKFNPRQYNAADVVTTGNNVMWNGLRKLGDGKDLFSFATTKEESDGIQTGSSRSYGFFIKAAYINATDVKWFVTYAYDKSDAGQKGVKRGWILNKVNNTLIGYNQASIDLLNALLFGEGVSASLEFIKHDGTAITLTLNKTEFQSNSVLYSNVISTNGKKVGYLVFNAFLGEPSRIELAQVFNSFQTAGITELIVDLRNNGGGSTETADLLTNLIAPASANGKTMYSYEFNPLLQKNKFPLLKQKFGFRDGSFELKNNTVTFKKSGNLNFSRVFFITTHNSASASELLINNLKPVMNVQLIGDTTRGKPVGFFPIVLFNKVALYPVSFRTINSAGTNDYYSGFAPDKRAPDGINKDWGDITEPCLAAALYFISNNRYAVAPNTMLRSVIGSPTLQQASDALSQGGFTGMYIERK